MLPFRKLLSLTVEFEKNDEVNDFFIKSKDQIAEAIKEGVKIFYSLQEAASSIDWSKTDIGFFLA